MTFVPLTEYSLYCNICGRSGCIEEFERCGSPFHQFKDNSRRGMLFHPLERLHCTNMSSSSKHIHAPTLRWEEYRSVHTKTRRSSVCFLFCCVWGRCAVREATLTSPRVVVVSESLPSTKDPTRGTVEFGMERALNWWRVVPWWCWLRYRISCKLAESLAKFAVNSITVICRELLEPTTMY